MKKLWTFLGVTVFAALVGCGKDDAQIQEKAISAPVENLAVHESTSVVQSTSDDRQKSAFEQAELFCRENGLQEGFDSERKRLINICSSSFDYEKTMSDEELARKRYLAFQRALMSGAFDISRLLERVAEISGREGRLRDSGLDCFFISRFIDEEDDESWIPQLMKRMMGRNFAWRWRARLKRLRLKSSIGTTKMEFPVHGLSIVRQYESVSKDLYQVALIVSLDVEKWKSEIMSFYDGKPASPGKMSLRQWMDTQDFGVVVGPRRFVDNEGTTWALGVVPAAEGQQPYGTLLDAAARECATFAFGGDLAVSIDEKNPYRTTTGIEDESWCVKDNCLIDFRAIGVEDWYPRELEQYFRRPYTHPLTGRKGVVAICALRSGASKFAKEIHERRMKKMQEKQYEAGMRAGMLDVLKVVAKELDNVRTDDDVTMRRISKLKHEISRMEDVLQDERSMRPKNRKRTEERLAEITRKVTELKGGKSNENQ